ncbi:hypothetical protein [Glycomyces sp. NPDC047010]|uniref:hypothetical protein n=1 Tax=Glycomyces sp. NPDC047010 TaxID=3155023 RepID=UPI0033E64127
MTPPSRPPHGRASKDKGRNFENHVLEAVRRTDPDAKRNGTLYGPNDHGDIDVPILDLVIQVKNTKHQSLLTTLDAARAQAQNAGRANWATVHRYRRGDSYAPHVHNAWSFEEALALRLLHLWGLWEAGVLVFKSPEPAADEHGDLRGDPPLLARLGGPRQPGRPLAQDPVPPS